MSSETIVFDAVKAEESWFWSSSACLWCADSADKPPVMWGLK